MTKPAGNAAGQLRPLGQTCLVAVYGTLKKGRKNHGYLRRARMLGADRLNTICLLDLGPYPGAVLQRSEGIEVEVYSVSARQLDRLDRLEGYRADQPALGLYDRMLVPTRFGRAWVYLYNKPRPSRKILRRGGW